MRQHIICLYNLDCRYILICITIYELHDNKAYIVGNILDILKTGSGCSKQRLVQTTNVTSVYILQTDKLVKLTSHQILVKSLNQLIKNVIFLLLLIVLYLILKRWNLESLQKKTIRSWCIKEMSVHQQIKLT